MQKNAKIYSGNGQGLEDDECEEAKERRNRFQNERTIVSSKMNNHIPDTLENVVTSEPSKLASRGRGRGRSTRGNRGGRFNTQNSGNFNPRYVQLLRFLRSLCLSIYGIIYTLLCVHMYNIRILKYLLECVIDCKM